MIFFLSCAYDSRTGEYVYVKLTEIGENKIGENKKNHSFRNMSRSKKESQNKDMTVM